MSVNTPLVSTRAWQGCIQNKPGTGSRLTHATTNASTGAVHTYRGADWCCFLFLAEVAVAGGWRMT